MSGEEQNEQMPPLTHDAESSSSEDDSDVEEGSETTEQLLAFQEMNASLDKLQDEGLCVLRGVDSAGEPLPLTVGWPFSGRSLLAPSRSSSGSVCSANCCLFLAAWFFLRRRKKNQAARKRQQFAEQMNYCLVP
eukprot:587385-Prorocentrum_minimum.AAC.2